MTNKEAQALVDTTDETEAEGQARTFRKHQAIWHARIGEKLSDVQAEALVDTLAETLGDTEKQSNVLTLGDMGTAEFADTLA